MDYSYYNSNNERVSLNIYANAKWDQLNIQNEYLNSIFSKIDDGDGIVSEMEFNLLSTILKKADTLLKPSDKLLENKELENIVKQIDEDKIKLPRQMEKNELNFAAHIVHDCTYTDSNLAEYKRNNPQKYKENEIKYIKEEMNKHFIQYPSDEYDMKIIPSDRFGRYDIYYYPKTSQFDKIHHQTNTVLRADGIELELKDYYENSINDDENADYSKIHQAANFGTFTITDKNGKKHELNYLLNDAFDRDVLDCRRITQKVCEFLSNLPEDVINELIEKNVKECSFTAEIDPSYNEEYQKKLEQEVKTKGYALDILGLPDDCGASFIIPDIAIENKKQRNLSIQREDGFKFELLNSEDRSSKLNISSPANEIYNIEVLWEDNNKFNTWQMPKLQRMFEELPYNVLKDLTTEISAIKLMDKWGSGNGEYVLGANAISYKADYDFETPVISFVHEIGHSIDDQNGTMFSENPKFSAKFSKFKDLCKKLNIDNNYAMTNSAEFFASTYAYQNYSQEVIENNHIAELEVKINEYKDSTKIDEKECYKLFLELMQDVKNHVEKVRNLPQAERANNDVSNIVKQECKNILSELNKYHISEYFPGQNIEADIISTLTANDKDYNTSIKYYEKFSNNSFENELGIKIEMPEEVQEQFRKLIEKIKEIRIQTQP